ncbi:MAG: Flp family type IVb pilin [Minwuiales bacterium]|nr:Flp family type IVb pilin [Minwuiales bacterium]
MVDTIQRFLADEAAATAIEYGLIAALVSVAAIVALLSLGDSLATLFNTIAGLVQNSVS